MNIPYHILASNEIINETIDYEEQPNVNFSIYTVIRPDLQSGDEVLLEVRETSMPCVLLGGNSVKLNVLQGFGRLTVIELASGIINHTDLEPNTESVVSANNILYWVENLGIDSLIIRDHCDDFQPLNEPSLKNVVQSLISIS